MSRIIEAICMGDAKTFRLSAEDVRRIDDLIERIAPKVEKMGMKKVKQTIMLRALIFNSEDIKDDELLEALKKAHMCA